VPGAKRGAHTGPNPTDRAKKGCKRHVLTDADGIPLVVQVGPANQRDDGKLEDLLEAFPVLTDSDEARTVQVQPRRLLGDRGYGFPHLIEVVHLYGIAAQLAARGKDKEHGSGLGKQRYVVERTMSWWPPFRRITVCWERSKESFQGLHELAACVLCAHKLRKATQPKGAAALPPCRL
jgi:transposase